ncbi:MAG: molybdopterin-guanine dinucleotide biosynthesis protein B [Sulfurospirillum sp.]|jgi:molybdopterin-guanine dinucleotide biosynthesis protein B|nr:molybdopterin-guanine dinucleotide biosynthesis protein B [Sulfurospirillum sp.]MBP9613031.1 molybdopterin-guanine dinucleotide biosynthesis protein B [Sulfurospirillum sp.]
MKSLAVAFTGPSDSGKTTLIVKVATLLKKEYALAIIKNDPSDKAVFDVEGKDSWKFSQTGAEVVITSPTRTTLFSKRQKDLDEIITMLGDFDFLLVEGLKNLPLPRIAIFRNKLDESYFDCSDAIAVDESVTLSDYAIPSHIALLDLNNPEQVVAWIEKNAKKVK